MTTRPGKCLALLAATVLMLVAALYWPELRARYRFWRGFENLGLNEQGYVEYQHRPTGIVFVSLPGGTFMMGSPPGEAGRSDNELQHEVTLSPFLIAKYEVSQEQWERVMGENPSRFKGDNFPVERVSWEECKDFCRRTGLALPTEARWEYACRAGTTTPFAFGRTITTDQVKYNGDHRYAGAPRGEVRARTVPVDSFEPNAFGLYQMHGNVSECCEDVYDENFYSRPESTRRDPVCTSGAEFRVRRGGAFNLGAGASRSACRGVLDPTLRIPFFGFRPCVDRRAYLPAGEFR